MGELIEWFGWDQHASKGLNRQINAGHSSDLSGPWPSAVHNGAGTHWASAGFRAGDAVTLALDSCHRGVLPQPGSVMARPAHESDRWTVSRTKPIDRTEPPANNIIRAN